MNEVVGILGWTTAMLGNPQVLIAGYLVARKPPSQPISYFLLLIAIVVCVAIHFALGASSRWGRDILCVSLATALATAIFSAFRSFRERRHRSELGAEV
ncbi:hypothetical protein [Sphingopyxis witflariensis]|uniref:Uncharacterized protein n=1 Tax=Sphingopyxis witflariensis TaxID=173675 RepID=A0A246JYY1_9SPHN|nr:hypothetical protein [Sphingopyxis witflariensis]OWQ98391.1 hypothetical protein CDQ91_07855 [Sphingopyxis witflariensis]